MEHIIINNTIIMVLFTIKKYSAQSEEVLHMNLFMGPKQMETLRSMSDEWTYAVDYGIFGFFSRVLLFMLKLFYMAVQIGIAILFYF